MTKFLGRHDQMSFELVVDDDQLISFYIVMPKAIRRFIEQQIQARFPESVIEVVNDYNVFNPQGQVLISELTLQKHQMFPLSTFEDMEVDPLEAIMNALSKFEKGESAVIQYLIRSADKGWHATR